MTQLPSLERWALLPFLGFSYPNLLLVFLNLLFLGTCIICFSQVLDFLWVFFILFYFSVPYFGLACDHGNSFLCLEEQEREGYWIEVRTVFNVKTTTTTKRFGNMVHLTCGVEQLNYFLVLNTSQQQRCIQIFWPWTTRLPTDRTVIKTRSVSQK